MAGRCVRVLWRRSCSGSAAPAVEEKKPGRWERIKSWKVALKRNLRAEGMEADTLALCPGRRQRPHHPRYCPGCHNYNKIGSVFWTRSLLRDYGEACKDIVVGAKERPGKAALYLSLLAGVGVCSAKAPSEDSFQCHLLEASASLLLLSPWTRSGKSDQHVQRLIDLRNGGRLRHINLLLFSLVYEVPYDQECDLYMTQCPHLKPRWSDFPHRVLDIGFFGHWWLFQNKMKDFDVNEEEFANLPAHMRTISFNDLHTQENEKLYEIKFQPVVMAEDGEK